MELCLTMSVMKKDKVKEELSLSGDKGLADTRKIDSMDNAPLGSEICVDPKTTSMTFANLCSEAKLLLTMAVPITVTNVFFAVTRMSRTYYVGRFTSPESLAAVSLTGSMSNITGYSLV